RLRPLRLGGVVGQDVAVDGGAVAGRELPGVAVLGLAPPVAADVGHLLLVDVGAHQVVGRNGLGGGESEHAFPLDEVPYGVHALRAVPLVVPHEDVELAPVDAAVVVVPLHGGLAGPRQVVADAADRAR